MSVLVVGLSHRSAPVAVLEQAAVTDDALGKLLRDVFHAENVAGTFTVSTCNRVEIYADVDKFHAGVSVICEMLARHSGVALPELTPHLYVHYEDRAVQHLLSMTCGLESMVVGESQILGQVRQALALARKHQTLGHALDGLGMLALRTAKRAHAQTGIDRAGANLVTVGAGLAAAALGAPVTPASGTATSPAPGATAPPDSGTPLHGRTVLVVGAGSMSALAVATAARLGAAGIVVANRTRERAERLAASVGGTTAGLHDLRPALAAADLVISCTGAAGLVITEDMVTAALRARERAGAARPLVLLDLALPHDVDPRAGHLPGVTVIGLESLQDAGASLAASQAGDVAEVRAIVAEELAARASARHAARVAPTVVALRAKAVEVVETELARLAGKLGEIDDRTRAEIAQAMHRVMDKLLHAPTVRVKELAGSPGGDSYEVALRVLFDLDPGAVEAVTRADAGLVAGGPPPAVPPEQEAR
ncbi:MAG TPA: glutamyl-tRNA reductase [Streptosporangiaceae bacterium]|nr:glutamyl-tRNA reductase [Streptosporangiaceae bacterium]